MVGVAVVLADWLSVETKQSLMLIVYIILIQTKALRYNITMIFLMNNTAMIVYCNIEHS